MVHKLIICFERIMQMPTPKVILSVISVTPFPDKAFLKSGHKRNLVWDHFVP